VDNNHVVIQIFLISYFRHALNAVRLLLGDLATSEFYVFSLFTPPMKMEQTDYSETSAYKIQTPGNHGKQRIQKSKYYLVVVSDSLCNLTLAVYTHANASV
jgi:hypothetical protein